MATREMTIPQEAQSVRAGSVREGRLYLSISASGDRSVVLVMSEFGEDLVEILGSDLACSNCNLAVGPSSEVYVLGDYNAVYDDNLPADLLGVITLSGIDSAGGIAEQMVLNLPQEQMLEDFLVTSDGFVLVGSQMSEFSAELSNGLLLHLNEQKAVLSSRTFGGSAWERLVAIVRADDGTVYVRAEVSEKGSDGLLAVPLDVLEAMAD